MSDCRSSPEPLVVQDLKFGYEPDRPVLTGVSGRLRAGRLCALLGPNAAGKSTLLRLMLGQLRLWGGSVRVDGQEIGKLVPHRRAALVSYVPHRGQVGFAFTVEQVVAMGRHALSANEDAIEWAMAVCELDDLRHRAYGALSTGQQQRVLLGRAMAQSRGNGQVMLLDEPVAALDLWHVHRTMTRLAELARGGMALLAVLHDMNLAARYADDVWLLHEGKLSASGPWEQVLQPRVLEPVYRVSLRTVAQQENGRPVFIVDDDDKI